MRLPAGYRDADLRRALALALQMAEGEAQLAIVTASDSKAETALEKLRDGLEAENTTLRQLFADLATPVLARGILGRSYALFVLGFPSTSVPALATLPPRPRL